MPSPNQSLTTDDFSGGRVDSYFLAPLNQFLRCDNLFPVRHGVKGKLLSRNGSELFDEDFPKTNPDGSRVAVLEYFHPNKSAAFKAVGNEILSIAARKIRYYTVGVGWTELQGSSGNSLFPAGVDTSNVVSTAQWNNHLFVTNDSFNAPSKVYIDSGGTRRLRTAGLPKLANTPNAQLVSFAAGATSFLYKVVYKYTYTVDTVTYIDRGAPTASFQALAANPPNADSIIIENIPAIANGATLNFDTANIKAEVYRTIANGTVFYYAGEVTNGTTTYTDTSSDATIQANAKLYTEGGVVANDPTPYAKFVFIIKDKAYWCHIKDASNQILENQVRQSIPGDIDSAPETFYLNVQDSIVGGGDAKGIPILICRNSVYRIDGEYDLLGRGGMVGTKIDDRSSCVSSQSIVTIPEGVVWAGEDAYYFSDGYQVMKINEDWVESYRTGVATLTMQKRIQGKYDARNRRVHWTVQEDSGGSSDCSFCDVLSLDWGIRQTSTLTTISGETQFAPTALVFIGDDMYRGDRYGYLIKHSPGLTTDPKVDDSVAVSLWHTKTVLWDYVSVATDFNLPNVRKYTTRIVLDGRNLSNASIQITSINDDGRTIEALKPIRWRSSFTWGDPIFVWGSLECVWASAGFIEEQRRFPASALRCGFKQIQITNASVPIINSDSFGTVTIDGTANTATLDSATTSWPEDCADYLLRLETDGYVEEFTVESNTSTTLTLLDPNGTFINAQNSKWILNGKPKGEVLNLMAYTIDFVQMGATEQSFVKSGSGELSS